MVELFGKSIQTRTHYCSLDDQPEQEITEPYLNLYVRTNGCNAECKFCEFQSIAYKFDEEKYINILNELKSKIRIKKVAFTGGEPTLNYSHFKNIVNITREIFPNIGIVLNTNGLYLSKLSEDTELLNKIDNIALSRHHYKDKINNQILGFKSSSTKELKSFSKKDILHFSCNLLKEYIDNEKDVYKFLEFASNVGVYSVGLVSLMPINDYCKARFVGFDSLNLISDRFNITKEWTYKDCCLCKNFIYIPKKLENLVKVYYKNTYKPSSTHLTDLTFDGKHLMQGFRNEIIY